MDEVHALWYEDVFGSRGKRTWRRMLRILGLSVRELGNKVPIVFHACGYVS